jgi:threonine dehydratase
VSCLGGGGLMSGISTVLNDKGIKLYGVEPKGADSMKISLKFDRIISLGDVDNFVDGASVGRVGDLTFEMCKQYLDNIFVVDNGRISNEMLELYQEDGIIVEPAGCLSICGLDYIKDLKGKKVVCIVSGGNNDIMRYPEILEKNSIYLGVKHYYIVEFSQKPMELRRFIEYVLDEGDDITRFEYIKKTNKTYGQVLVGFESNNIDRLEKKMNLKGFKFRKINESDLIFSYLI